MDTFSIIILPSAQKDLLEVVEYVNTLSPQAALRLYDEIVNGIGSLTKLPERCGLLKTPELRLKGYRALQVDKYTVFFVIIDDVVQIRRILFSKRQFESIL